MNPIAKNSDLFLQQSMIDAWDNYQDSLVRKHFVHWDYIILTASNDEQAKSYQLQLDNRIKAGLLPQRTHYAVLPDPNGIRVGSGGATLNVIKYIRNQDSSGSCFKNKRILVIHSGGDSKRVPQYSACGKLFSPVPRQLPDGRRSTLFDEFIISLSGVPARLKDGMFVMSGDVLLLFNHLQIDFQFRGAAAISMKENVMTGKNHGVYKSDEKKVVSHFLHKYSEAELQKLGAVNMNGDVDLDTGAVILDSGILQSLLNLICIDGRVDEHKFKQYVNDHVQLSFYGDFLYPLASESSLEEFYRQRPENCFSPELNNCRDNLWQALSHYTMTLICLSPARFLHFGTTYELLKLVTEDIHSFSYLNWRRSVLSNRFDAAEYACNLALIDTEAMINPTSYIEASRVGRATIIGDHCVISNLDLNHAVIPDHTVLHGLKLKTGHYVVRVYGILDNPKTQYPDAQLFGIYFTQYLNLCGLTLEDIWEANTERSLWTAKLFPVGETPQEALRYALLLIKMAQGKCEKNEIDQWKQLLRTSLFSSYQQADQQAIMNHEQEIEQSVRIAQFIHAIQNRKPIDETGRLFGTKGIDQATVSILVEKAKDVDFSTKIRIYFYLSKLLSGTDREEMEGLCFDTIKQELSGCEIEPTNFSSPILICRDEVISEMPIRVNFGGGWSDTPPYCNEMGGTVLNAALTLNGQYPIKVVARRLEERHVVFESVDSGARETFSNLNTLYDCSNPFDYFALHKAALLVCGIIPYSNNPETTPQKLEHILDGIGGGIFLSTEVVNVPRGSGLGTSSILAAACIKSLYKLINHAYTETDLFSSVIAMEQIMSTGGGWQDQVGGVVPGIKFIRSDPGLRQSIQYDVLKLSEQTWHSLQKRFTLIYTGQRRLARNLLRDVMGGYIGSSETSKTVLYDIQKLAVLMKFELEKGNVDAFAALMNDHWELSKHLDQGSTNTCIEQIFNSCDDLLSGKMICGAGGGGFLQVMLKDEVTIDMLRGRLKSIFQDSGIDVWNCEFIH